MNSRRKLKWPRGSIQQLKSQEREPLPHMWGQSGQKGVGKTDPDLSIFSPAF